MLKFLKKYEKKIERLKACFYALEVGTILCSGLDKIFTFIALSFHGAWETNPIAATLFSTVGIIPGLIIGFIATLLPLILIHYGIRKFKWNKESHYWIYSIFMTVYFVIFFKLVQAEIGWYSSL